MLEILVWGKMCKHTLKIFTVSWVYMAFIWKVFALVTSAVSFLLYSLLTSYANPNFQKPINENFFISRLLDALLPVLDGKLWDLQCAFLDLELLVKSRAVIGAGILNSYLQQDGVTTFCIESGRTEPGFDMPEVYMIGGNSLKKRIQNYA